MNMTHWSCWLHTCTHFLKKENTSLHVCMQPCLRASQWLGLIPQNHNSSKINLQSQPHLQLSAASFSKQKRNIWWTNKSSDVASQSGVSKCQSALLRQWNAMSMDLSFIRFHQSICCKIKMNWFKIHKLAFGYMEFGGNLTEIKYKYIATNVPWLFIWCT